MSTYDEDLQHLPLQLRVCCDSLYSQNHLTTCPRMVALDHSYVQDVFRHIDSYTNHTSEALHDRALLAN